MFTVIMSCVAGITGIVIGVAFSARMYHRVRLRPEILERLNQVRNQLTDLKNQRDTERDGASEERWNELTYSIQEKRARERELEWVLSIQNDDL